MSRMWAQHGMTRTDRGGMDSPDQGGRDSPEQGMGRMTQTLPASHPPQETMKRRSGRNGTETQYGAPRMEGHQRPREQTDADSPDQGLRDSPEKGLGNMTQIPSASGRPRKQRDQETKRAEVMEIQQVTLMNRACWPREQVETSSPDQGLGDSPEQDSERLGFEQTYWNQDANRGRREAAEAEIERLVRKIVETPEVVGQIKGVQKNHIILVIKSRASERVIGTERGHKVWGWLAKAVREKSVLLANQWISKVEHRVNELRADAAWALTGEQTRKFNAMADREESLGSVRTWMKLNEEPARNGFQVLREEKREALRSSRSNFFKRMGGAEAMYAAIALLTHSGEMVLERTGELAV